MEPFELRFLKLAVIWAGLLFVAAACTPASPAATAVEPSAVAAAPVADLTAVEANISVLHGEDQANALQKGEDFQVQVDDRIQVDESGRGELLFQGQIEVELFRGTELQISEVQMESGGPSFVRLNQIYGHTRLRVDDATSARATLETDYATLRTLEPGTAFMVCHAPGGLTCMVTLAGSVEVSAQGTKEVIKAGEATYIFPDQPPQPPICGRMDQVSDWRDRMRGTEDIEALGELVAGWPAEPCTAVAGSPDSTLPSAAGMVSVMAGEYEVGSSQVDDFHLPVQKQIVAAFWIDSHEVTNAQYKLFLEAAGETQPLTWPGEPYHPVEGVTWDQASAYCSWVKKRLPTEVEWEVAARGPGPNPPLYPWGNDPQAGGEVMDLPRSTTYPAGAVSFNVSPFGAYDMIGNLWEWVDEPYAPVPEGRRILRGGRYGFLIDAAYRQITDPNDERLVPLAGFRCAAEQVEGG